VELSVIALNFDSEFQFAGVTVRWQTVALVASIVLMLGAAAAAARVPLAVNDEDPPEHQADPTSFEREGLSRLDLLMVAFGTIPGAIVAGRLGYLLAHLDYYASQPALWLNLDQGSLELGSAVVGGTLTGMLVAFGMSTSPRRWLHIAAAPLLLGLTLGKLAMALGGEGQGLLSNDVWATAYIGTGPWGSQAPALPALPAQAYEALLTFAALVALLALRDSDLFREADGRAFVAALFLWGVARTGAGFWWRDPPVIGPLRSVQLISLAIAVVAGITWFWLARRQQQLRT
jgi:prolipoprotein diacylglyceryltransferase